MGSSRELVVFTINVSIASKRILDAEGLDPTSPPKEPDCHLRQRIGELLPYVGKDHWWQLGGDSDVSALRRELARALVWHGIPWLRINATDGSLRALFEQGRGSTRGQAARFARELAEPR